MLAFSRLWCLIKVSSNNINIDCYSFIVLSPYLIIVRRTGHFDAINAIQLFRRELNSQCSSQKFEKECENHMIIKPESTYIQSHKHSKVPHPTKRFYRSMFGSFF